MIDVFNVTAVTHHASSELWTPLCIPTDSMKGWEAASTAEEFEGSTDRFGMIIKIGFKDAGTSAIDFPFEFCKLSCHFAPIV